MPLSPEDRQLVDEMNAITLEEVQRVAPDIAEDFLIQFRSLSADYTIFAQMDGLERAFAQRVHTLQTEGLLPDFFTLRERALANLRARSNTDF